MSEKIQLPNDTNTIDFLIEKNESLQLENNELRRQLQIFGKSNCIGYEPEIIYLNHKIEKLELAASVSCNENFKFQKHIIVKYYTHDGIRGYDYFISDKLLSMNYKFIVPDLHTRLLKSIFEEAK
jgi:hypothetical protein